MTERHRKFAFISALFFFLLLSIVFVVLFSYQRAYAQKIYRNVHFADIDLSGKTKAQAEFLLQAKIENVLKRDVVISANDKEVKAILADTGLSFDLNKIINDSYSIGRDDDFFRSLLGMAKTIFFKKAIVAEPFINQTRFDDFQTIALGQLNIEPKDASLTVKNGVIEMTESSVGQKVDTANFDDLVVAAINSDDPIVLPVVSVAPKVTSADFTAAKAAGESILAKKITFVYQDKSYSPTRIQIGDWLSFVSTNDIYTLAYNDSNIKAYLGTIARNFEVAVKDTKINASNNEVIVAGVQGLYLNKDKALADLKILLNSSQNPVVTMVTTTKDPAEVKVFPNEGFVPGRFEGKYIDIDLTTQQLCRVEGTVQVDCFLVSSGKASMPTPTGTYSVLSKNPMHYSNAYQMWLPWWEEFDSRGYGIHELPQTATWKETDVHLGTPVSHGCVRLGVGPAETVYNWTEVGTPIYIHK